MHRHVLQNILRTTSLYPPADSLIRASMRMVEYVGDGATEKRPAVRRRAEVKGPKGLPGGSAWAWITSVPDSTLTFSGRLVYICWRDQGLGT